MSTNQSLEHSYFVRKKIQWKISDPDILKTGKFKI